MSFWQTSDGTDAAQQAQADGGKFEMLGGDLAPIPEDTNVLAIAEEATNKEYEGNHYINVKWRISKPAEYANRVIFQKLQIFDPSKADKAKRMLAAIASNAGGGLFAAMQQRNESAPSDMSLAQICNRPMVLKLGVWELEDKSKSGNWIKAVAPAKSGTAAPVAPTVPKVAPAAPAPAPAAPAAPVADDLDDIPF